MKDPKASKRKRLAQAEVDRMCARYKYECKELGTRMETEQEKEKRLNKHVAETRYKNRFQLQL